MSNSYSDDWIKKPEARAILMCGNRAFDLLVAQGRVTRRRVGRGTAYYRRDDVEQLAREFTTPRRDPCAA